MGHLRFLLALWLAKLSIPALKLTHHNGTDFPGSLATKICPNFLHYVQKPKLMVAVTGTNGKTTVSNMLIDILEKQGLTVLNNRAGSNIRSGISTSFIYGSSLLGKLKPFDLAVLEIDERSAPLIYKHLQPNFIVITNLFRDSIMRNAHPEYISKILSNNIPKESKLILNADDLFSATLCPENSRVYYGIGPLPTDTILCENLLNDLRICPSCAYPLEYTYRKYHHIGHAVCAHCGFESPTASYLASSIDSSAHSFIFQENGQSYTYPTVSDSLHNIYNEVTVITTLRELGYSHETIQSSFSATGILSSRQNVEKVGHYRIVMQMSKDKNALACTRNFDDIRSHPGKKELLLMMNCLSVTKKWSENPSWLYDTDFKFLNSPDVVQYICAGPRCYDYRLRLQYSGISDNRIVVEPDEFKALNLLKKEKGESIYILYGVDGMPLAFRVKDKLKEMLLKEESHVN